MGIIQSDNAPCEIKNETQLFYKTKSKNNFVSANGVPFYIGTNSDMTAATKIWKFDDELTSEPVLEASSDWFFRERVLFSSQFFFVLERVLYLCCSFFCFCCFYH
jgi:hypothetical protein